MDDQYNFETRLHSQAQTLEELQTYWAEYDSYAGSLSDATIYKVLREFAHKYLQFTGEPYEDGVLDIGDRYTINQTTPTIDATLITADKFSI